ncbi:MAG: hypothetical protein Q7J98_09990 [Kiritimatiellia bacterium]|nr:hypothetical protein [Kiritimatiellia bacterium]
MTQGKKYSSREEQALAEAGRTTISPAQKRLLVAIFLFAIFFVPVGQQIADLRAYFNGSRGKAVPQCYDIFGSVFSALKKISRPAGHPLECLFSANRQLLRDMRAYEDSLEDSSLAGRVIRPSIQYVMTRWLGAGNDKTYCGRSQWLFYRPDIDCVINHGFLEKDIIARRAASGSETAAAPHPDPRPAIFAFNAELAARGIKLILMPTPVKPVIHPEKFAAGFEDFTRPIHNRDYQEFIRDMEKAGIPVFDPSQTLVQDKEVNKCDQFLAGDTHWRPEAMELCSRHLREFIQKNIFLPAMPVAGYTAAITNIVQRGDIVAMLRLPERGSFFGAATVNIRQIFKLDGQPWQPSKEADILVLGDSFANIYSLEAMGWGSNAGLVEQLSYEMQRPVDRIALNDNSARATREQLRRELSRGNDRLAGKRAVIWQFAVRELTEGDWKVISLKSAPQKSSFLTLSAGSELSVTGEIKAIARVPRPGSVPYADHIVAVHLVNVKDRAGTHGQALVYLLSMTNHVLTEVAGLKAGDSVNLWLRPWSEVSASYERINRTELDDSELLIQEPCWGEISAVKQ